MARKAEAAHGFVKAATTTSVSKSQQDVMTVLRRYGAVGFGVEQEPGRRAVVRFTLPNIGPRGEPMPFELIVHVEHVYAALFGGRNVESRGAIKRTKEEQARTLESWREQAERTAWRILVDWLDASLSMVQVGARSAGEVFLADMVLDAGGQRGRFIEYVQTALRSGGLPALPTPKQER